MWQTQSHIIFGNADGTGPRRVAGRTGLLLMSGYGLSENRGRPTTNLVNFSRDPVVATGSNSIAFGWMICQIVLEAVAYRMIQSM